MKQRELFSNLITVPPIFVRIDGRAFHRLASHLAFEKPFDQKFHQAMVSVSESLVSHSGLNPDFAYTFSDEISLYFSSVPFRGRVEKIDSIASSYAASALSLNIHPESPVAFDARIVQITPELAAEYLKNRQHEAWRNHINAYCQAALLNEGMTPADAQRKLLGMPSKELHEMMYARGVNLAATPTWQRRGALVYKMLKKVHGFNPVTNETAETLRSSVTIDEELPLFNTPEGHKFLVSLIREP
ncbi:MAG: tRNA 5'-guanylyltransferase [Methanoregulaceae archaeon]|jgi:tRNA(His) 5'-end guanylyltransferase|nr:tRNA 5'-guanylyltransferase [Methanoregulaceae archaeon]